MGGPVYVPSFGGLPKYDGRNRSFFFVSVEKLKSENDALERKGDFSQTISLNNTPLGVYDPNTTQIIIGKTVRQTFPNNAIPVSWFDRTGGAVMNLFELPNQTGAPRVGAFNWTGQGRFASKARWTT